MGGMKLILNGDYAVTIDGDVISIKSNKSLRSHDNGHGYKTVCLCIDGKPKTYYVHRLVASAFVENPNDYPEVNHIDEDRGNNRAENLEWCTSKYNKNYGRRAERFGRRRGRPVVCLETGQVFYSCGDAGRNMGIRREDIHACCTGYRNTHSAGRYHWAFADISCDG